MILAFTNAKLNLVNFLGIQLELDPTKFYIALLIFYMYFVWRFLTKLPLISGFWNDFLQYYMNSESGVKREHNFKKYQAEFFKLSTDLQEIKEKNLDPRITTTNIIRHAGNSIRHLKLSVNFHRSQPKLGSIIYDFTVDYDIVVSRQYFLKKLIVFSLKYDKFGDYLFPIIPIVINLAIFLSHSEWQGSFRNLLK
jgi:hypothetical protein